MFTTVFLLGLWALIASAVAYLALAWGLLLDVDRTKFAEEIRQLRQERGRLRRDELYWRRVALGTETPPAFDPTLPRRWS